MKTEIIYVGVREATSGKKLQKYVYKNDPDTTAVFASKLLGVETIGSVLSTEVEGNTFKRTEYVGQLDSSWDSKVTKWSAEHRATLELFNQRREAKKEHPETIDNLILKMQNAMWHLSPKARRDVARYVFEKLLS